MNGFVTISEFYFSRTKFDVRRNATDFELYNCVQWLHCILHLEYDRLDLSNETIFSYEKCGYLFESNMEKMVLFQRSFKTSFEKRSSCKLL